MICKYFLSIVAYLFVFFVMFFCRAKILILVKPNLAIFVFQFLNFGLCQGHKILQLYFLMEVYSLQFSYKTLVYLYKVLNNYLVKMERNQFSFSKNNLQ